MNKFTFSLQGVLNAKSKIEDSARTELSRLIAEEARIEAAIDRLSDTRRAHDDHFRQGLGSGLSVVWLRAAHKYAAELTRQIAHHCHQASQAEEKVQAQRDQVIERTKERRCFEALRQRRHTAYRRESLRAQYNEIDEIFSTRRKEPQDG